MKTLRKILAERRARRAAEKAQRFRELVREPAQPRYPDHTKTGMVKVIHSGKN